MSGHGEEYYARNVKSLNKETIHENALESEDLTARIRIPTTLKLKLAKHSGAVKEPIVFKVTRINVREEKSESRDHIVITLVKH